MEPTRTASPVIGPPSPRTAPRPGAADPPRAAPALDPVAYATTLATLIDALSDPDNSSDDHAGTVVALISGAQYADISAPAPVGKAAGSTGDRSTHRRTSVDPSRAEGPPSPPVRPALAEAGLVLEQLQHSVGEGPALDVVDRAQQVLVQDLHTDRRWPLLVARAPWQIRSILCTPLVVGSRVGVLTVLSTQAWAFGDISARQASVVATHVALAMNHARHIRNLMAMARTRDLIGQAKGILMHQHRCTAAQAFDRLVSVSQNTNVAVLAVSEHLVDTGELPAYPTVRRRRR